LTEPVDCQSTIPTQVVALSTVIIPTALFLTSGAVPLGAMPLKEPTRRRNFSPATFQIASNRFKIQKSRFTFACEPRRSIFQSSFPKSRSSCHPVKTHASS
jgi:hypothetical protein